MKINIKNIMDENEAKEVVENTALGAKVNEESESSEEYAKGDETESESEPQEAEEQKPEAPETPETLGTPGPEAENLQESEETQMEEGFEGFVCETEDCVQGILCKIIKTYGEIIAIAAVFLILIGVMLGYTNLVPREVYAEIDGEQTLITSKAWTVEEFLEEEDIAYSGVDYISVPLTAFIRDGIHIKIEHAVDYKIKADGSTKNCKTTEKTVAAALREEHIKLGAEDIVEPDLKATVKEGMTIVVKRVKIEEKTVVEKVHFKTIKKDDPSMNHGETKVVQKGKNGKAKVTYRIKYVDGKQVSKKKIKSKVITPKKNKIIKVGTKNTIDGFAYTKKFVVKAYSYTGGGRTAMGTNARVGEIAVDPSVIPLGTDVYIEGVGVRRAEDTGGNIKGNTIDIYMNSQSECLNWGCRYVTIYM